MDVRVKKISKDPTNSFWVKNGLNREICHGGRKNEIRIFGNDGVKARAPKAKAVVHKAKDKDINRDQGHDEPTKNHFL